MRPTSLAFAQYVRNPCARLFFRNGRASNAHIREIRVGLRSSQTISSDYVDQSFPFRLLYEFYVDKVPGWVYPGGWWKLESLLSVNSIGGILPRTRPK